MTRTHQIPAGTMQKAMAFETQKPAEQPEPTTEPTNTVSSPNFCAWLLNEDMLTEEFVLLGTKFVNQLTGRVAWYLDRHVAQQQRRDLDTDVASLDQRNEQDENARGKELHDTLTEFSGFEVPLTPYQLAEICDGLRHRVYDAVNEKLDGKLPDPKQVLMFGEYPINGFTNLESTLRNNIERSAQPSAKMKQQIANRKFGSSEAAATARAATQAAASARAMHDRLNGVLVEANSLDYYADADDWMKLPERDRNTVVQRIINGLQIVLDPENPAGLRAKADAAFTAQEQVRRGNEIVTHELALQRMHEWAEKHGAADDSDLATAKKLQAELLKRSKAKPAPTTVAPAGIEGLENNLPF